MQLYPMLSLAVVAGVISFTSPCTLPLLPGYLSYICGMPTTADSGQLPIPTRRRALGRSMLFVLGFSAVFTALGATSSAIGFALARHLRILEIAAGALIIGFGIVTTGLLRVPMLQRQIRIDLTRVGRGAGGALMLGASFGFGWTPCVGPVLAAILTTAASTANLGTGALLLFAYSIGLGLPFLLLATGITRGRHRFTWLKLHGRGIEMVGGALLIAMGVAVLTGGWTALMSRMLAAYASVGWPPV